MRIRQVRQEFWTDELLADLPDAIRLFYIGLWCVADDAGWMRWEPHRIGALLYPYRSASRRERNIEEWTGRLVSLGRVVLHSCGCAQIPTLPRHQVVGGKRAETDFRRHMTSHSGPVRVVPEVPEVLSGRGMVGNVTVGNGTPAGEGGLKEKVGWRP